jgi:hypothetical protein
MATTLINKLRIGPGQSMLVLNAPEGYISELGELPEGAKISQAAEGVFDFVQLFVRSIAELEELAPSALKSINFDGLLWFCYPKQSSKNKTDINRDSGWNVVKQAGLRPVTQVAIDDTWSALRFRPVESVGS